MKVLKVHNRGQRRIISYFAWWPVRLPYFNGQDWENVCRWLWWVNVEQQLLACRMDGHYWKDLWIVD